MRCPKCSGSFISPSELGFYDDGLYLICDGEPNGSGCDFWVLKSTVKELQRIQSLSYKILRKLGLKKRKIYNIQTLEFNQIAWILTGIEWDFSKPYCHNCAVKSCFNSIEWGYWTCKIHRALELKYFDPIDEFGRLSNSHKGKEMA